MKRQNDRNSEYYFHGDLSGDEIYIIRISPHAYVCMHVCSNFSHLPHS